MKKVLSVFFAVLFVFMFIVPAFAANNRFIYSEKDGGYIDTETGISFTPTQVEEASALRLLTKTGNR